MLDQYLAILNKEIKESKEVKAYSQLNAEKWTKSCFVLLSKIIAEVLGTIMSEEQCMEIGTTISPRTLQKIITGDYKLKYPIDPRVLNTLNKLVIFVGAKDWDDFLTTRNPENTSEETTDTVAQDIQFTIQKALNEVFSCYQALPALKELKIENYFLKDQSAYKKVIELVAQRQTEKAIISNSFNPSTFEILDLDIKKIKESYAQVETTEYWLLCWWDTEKERYIQRYKSIATHYYILNKVEGQWKIKADATMSDAIEIDMNKPSKDITQTLAKAV